MVRSIRLLFFFGWGFSTTQQPSLCQNSLMFPEGSSFTLLPGAPQGSCSGAGTTHSLLWFTQQDRFRESGILRTLRHAGKVSASDPERLTGQPGTRLCLHQTRKPCPWTAVFSSRTRDLDHLGPRRLTAAGQTWAVSGTLHFSTSKTPPSF